MKFKYIILSVVTALTFTSCYEDLGNYDYKDINEITVKGIESRYAVDVDDSLKIYPKLEGTIYSDTSRFSYEWEIARRIMARTYDLELIINLTPGDKSGRFIITDKATNHKTYQRFDLNVSSSTAGDLIVVLSKFQGRAEMSYYRLDKPANFAVNYYKDRFGAALGTNPKQLHIRYCNASAPLGFANWNGRVMTLVDDQIKLIEKQSMMPDTVYRILSPSDYLTLANIPKPEIKDYKSQYIVEEGIDIWRKSAYGSNTQHQTYFNEISNGKLFFAAQSNGIWAPIYTFDVTSPYNKGPLSPFAFYDQMDPTPNSNLKQQGYETGNLMVFDYIAGRFAYCSYGAPREIIPSRMPAMPGYQLVYGSATVMPDNTFFCILNKDNTNKLLLIKRTKEKSTERDKDNVYTIISQGNCDNSIINATTKYYTMQKSSFVFFTSGNKLYKYNISDLSTPPGEQHIVAKLSDFGYDSKAKITSLFVSRTESNILLGVSRYGDDTDATGDEAKGDILAFSYDPSTLKITHNPKYSFKGISGIPVDIKVKYQTHWREGKNFDDILVDNI